MRRLWIAVPSFLLLGCVFESPAAPDAPGTALAVSPSTSLVGAPFFQVAHLQLRPAEGSGSRMFGPMLVRVGAWLPPNPCAPSTEQAPGPPTSETNPGPPDAETNPGPPVVGSSRLAFCGVLHNPGGETLLSAVFRVGGDARTDPVDLPARFTLPPNPCTQLVVSGVLAAPSVALNPGPPVVTATFQTTAGPVVGVTLNPGPPGTETAPGPPDTEVKPGPPNCSVQVATDAIDG